MCQCWHVCYLTTIRPGVQLGPRPNNSNLSRGFGSQINPRALNLRGRAQSGWFCVVFRPLAPSQLRSSKIVLLSLHQSTNTGKKLQLTSDHNPEWSGPEAVVEMLASIK